LYSTIQKGIVHKTIHTVKVVQTQRHTFCVIQGYKFRGQGQSSQTQLVELMTYRNYNANHNLQNK